MRKLLVLLASVTTGVFAGACGSTEDEGSSAKPHAKRTPKEPTAIETVQVAYKETADEMTAKTTFESTTTIPPGDSAEGEPAPMVFKIEGEGVTNFSGTEFAMTISLLGTEGFEARQLDGTVYLKPPDNLRPPEFPDAKPWIREARTRHIERAVRACWARRKPKTPHGSSSTCAASPTPSISSGWRRCAASGRPATRSSRTSKKRPPGKTPRRAGNTTR